MLQFAAETFRAKKLFQVESTTLFYIWQFTALKSNDRINDVKHNELFGTVARETTFKTRSPQFKSSHRQKCQLSRKGFLDPEALVDHFVLL